MVFTASLSSEQLLFSTAGPNLQVSFSQVYAQSTGQLLSQACPGKTCGKIKRPSRHDQSCSLRCKTANLTNQTLPYFIILLPIKDSI